MISVDHFAAGTSMPADDLAQCALAQGLTGHGGQTGPRAPAHSDRRLGFTKPPESPQAPSLVVSYTTTTIKWWPFRVQPVTPPGHEVQQGYQQAAAFSPPDRRGIGNHVTPARCRDMRKGALGSWRFTNFSGRRRSYENASRRKAVGSSSLGKLPGQQGREL
jgi:hypothetical protein